MGIPPCDPENIFIPTVVVSNLNSPRPVVKCVLPLGLLHGPLRHVYHITEAQHNIDNDVLILDAFLPAPLNGVANINGLEDTAISQPHVVQMHWREHGWDGGGGDDHLVPDVSLHHFVVKDDDLACH